jgi:hypothetical protein
MTDWGKGAVSNTIGWGEGRNNTISWGSIYPVSYFGQTSILSFGTFGLTFDLTFN